MALQQHRSRHPVDAPAPLLALNAPLDQRALGRRCREALVEKLHRQAGLPPDRIGEAPCRGSLGTLLAIEAQWKADDDPDGLMPARYLGQSRGQALLGLRRYGLERLGDGLGRVAQREAYAL